MSALVVDASVALKWVLVEPDSERARTVLYHRLVAPDWWRVEAANGLWKALHQGEVDLAEAREGLAQLADAPVETEASTDLLADAMTLADRLRHPVYDCLYLALAIRRGIRMITADGRFIKAIRREPEWAEKVVLLSEFTG